MPRMVVIPPGMEFNHIVVHDDVDSETEENEDNLATSDPPIWSEIMMFLNDPHKPMILALARPDPKKNIATLVKAFGECRPLRELTNLTLILGNREDIDEMWNTKAAVLTQILNLIDKYDLYLQVAYPKHHKQSDFPDIYRLAAKTKGVFINPAFIEPFGLTLIELMACLSWLQKMEVLLISIGFVHISLILVKCSISSYLSCISTDFINVCFLLLLIVSDFVLVLDNGLLIDPHDQNAISDALYKLVSDKQLWARCRHNGLKNIHLFSWPEHCKTYLSRIANCRPRHPQWQRNDDDGFENSESDSPVESLRDIQNISLNLKLSLDGEKAGETGSLDSLDSEENSTDRKGSLEKAVSKYFKGLRVTQKVDSKVKPEHSKLPLLRRRKHISVIAVDTDNVKDFIDIIKNIFEAASRDRMPGRVGFILSTALTISEAHSVIVAAGMLPTDFDALVCNSGSDLYYPAPNSDPSELPYAIDLDYHSQIEYRWGGEGLRKTLIRWAASVVEKKGES